jgi:hypothetical protein
MLEAPAVNAPVTVETAMFVNATGSCIVFETACVKDCPDAIRPPTSLTAEETKPTIAPKTAWGISPYKSTQFTGSLFTYANQLRPSRIGSIVVNRATSGA